jgi:hypothetical protein
VKPIGNVREYDLDFRRIWNSQAAEKMRKQISACCCIHGCNLATAMRFDAATYLEVETN